MDVGMGVVALAGGTLVLLVVVAAIVVLGMKALDRARPEDVPAVTEQVMRVLRDSRQAIQRRARPQRDGHLEQEQDTMERQDGK
ncbi:hypothetical protein ACWDDN_42465 [Streptomyces griseoruber]